MDITYPIYITFVLKTKQKAFCAHQRRKRVSSRISPELEGKGLICIESKFAYFSFLLWFSLELECLFVFLLPFVIAMKSLSDKSQDPCKKYRMQKLVERGFGVPGKLTLSSKSTYGSAGRNKSNALKNVRNDQYFGVIEVVNLLIYTSVINLPV